MFRAENSTASLTSLKGFSSFAIALLLGACASSQTIVQPGSKSAAPDQNKPRFSAIASQHISGTLIDYKSQTPVAGATVYVASQSTASTKMLKDLSLNNSKHTSECQAPVESHVAYVCTRADGSFDLPVSQVSQIPMPLVVVKNESRSDISLTLNDIGTDIGQLTLGRPTTVSEETIAIVLDFFDPYDDTSSQPGISQLDPESAFLIINDQVSEVLDMENPDQHIEFPKFTALFEDSDGDDMVDIFKYSSVYINSHDADDISNMDKKYKQELLRYIANGGQLYVTEWTFEQAEPDLDQYI